MNKSKLKEAFLATVPVLAGYLVIGLGFGMVLKSAGYGLGWAFGMSAFIYAGSMQYVLIRLLSSHASLFTVGLTTLLVNARHLFYGISMLEPYRGVGAKKPYLIYTLTDETYSLVCNHPRDPGFFFLVSLFDHVYWIAGSVLGSLLGSVLPFSTEGIDFSLTALFLIVLTDQWLSAKNHLPALIGLGASVLCLVIFGSDSFLIPTMLVISALLLALQPKLTEAESND